MRYTIFLIVLLCALDVRGQVASSPTESTLDIVKTEFKDQFTAGKDIVKVTLPREDLNLIVDGFQLPVEVGIESTFHFWKCPCGKLHVYGSFLVCDYESNDVIDELRAGHISIVSVAPFFQFDRPRMLQVRFQGEGKAGDLVASIKKAIGWIGENRMAPVKDEKK